MRETIVREILGGHGRLTVAIDKLTNDSDLHAAGLTSLTTVNVILAVEDAFDIEFEDRLLKRETFSSVNSLLAAIDELLGSQAA